jgi:hypothetical protein
MTAPAAPQLAPHAGPIEKEAGRLLAETTGAVQAVEIAKRSPVGPGAVKAEIAGDTARVADSLSSQDWIEEVAVRPRHLYLRVEPAALRAWLAGGAGEILPLGAEAKPRESPAPGPGEGESLAAFRQEAVAEALARIETLPGAAQGGDSPERPAVGAVDVRYGALRMRHGGVVGAEDAADELIEELDAALLTGLDPARFGRLALALLLLATPHRKHIQVDDAWLRQGVEEIGKLVQALRSTPSADPPVKPREEEVGPVHLLALELNGLPKKAGMAAERREPAFLARFALSLATLVEGATLPSADPLRDVAAVALAASLRLLAEWPEQLLCGSGAVSGGHRVEAQDVV